MLLCVCGSFGGYKIIVSDMSCSIYAFSSCIKNICVKKRLLCAEMCQKNKGALDFKKTTKYSRGPEDFGSYSETVIVVIAIIPWDELLCKLCL